MGKTELNFRLNNGLFMPKVAFGVWKPNITNNTARLTTQSSNQVVSRITEQILENGYRHIDCSQRYENLKEIGIGIRNFFTKQEKKTSNGRITYDDIWITAKVWACHNKNVEKGLDEILDDLGVTKIDLLLLEFPCGLKNIKNEDGTTMLYPSHEGKLALEESSSLGSSWKIMEKLYISGRVKSIGLSNVNEIQVQKILKLASVRDKKGTNW